MNVLSKYAIAEFTERWSPQQYLGLFDSVPYSCYECGHTWEPSCVRTWMICFHRAFPFSLKLYIPLYLITAMMQLRDRNADRKKIFKKTIIAILQSSFFLAMNGTYFLMAICTYRAIFGKFHGVYGYVTGFVSSFLSIILERKSRRGALSIYVFNLALETLFKMYVARGWVRPVKHGEIYLFAFSNMLYLSLFRAGNLPPTIQNLFQKIIGVEETTHSTRPVSNPAQRRNSLVNYIQTRYQQLLDYLNLIGPNVQSCHHRGSCFGYICHGAVKYFSIGYGLQILTRYRSVITAIIKLRISLLKPALSAFSIPKFFCAYVTLFRVTNCLLRWAFGGDHPTVFGALSGLFAGFSSALYPSTTISMYAVTKMMEILVMKAVAKNWLPYIKHFDVLLYSSSMAVMFHAAMLEPHNIRPGYWKFMISLSGNCFPLVFRILLDKFGTHASKLYPNFVPNVDPALVKSEEVRQALAFFGKWPYTM